LSRARAVRLALVAASVALGVAAYAPGGSAAAALFLFAPLAAALEGARPREAFAATWLFSLAFAVVSVRFLVYALAVEYAVPRLHAWGLTVAVIGAFALVPSAAMALYAELRPRVGAAFAPLLFASLQALSEWIRAVPLGMPWIVTAQAVAFSPLWIQLGDLGGIAAIAFLAALVSAAVGLALRLRGARPLAAAGPLVAAALAYGALRLASPVEEGAALDVAVVQAAVPQRERFVPGSISRNLALHVSATRALAAEARPDLVVWSETSIDGVLETSPGVLEALHALADETGTPIVTGTQRLDAEGKLRNSVVRVTPGRDALDAYAKQALVPFAETRPAWGAPLEPLLAPVMADGAYWPGESPTVFDGPVPFATPVCFEITYPHLVRAFRSAGAALLVNLSNDAWFGRTAYAELHLAHAVLRAVELRSWVVRGANTGISAVVDPTGRVRERLGLFENGRLRARVHVARGVTFYGRFGDTPVVALLAALVVAAALRRHSGEGAGASPSA
jgi:apolipoprotein N-acyltransferase